MRSAALHPIRTSNLRMVPGMGIHQDQASAPRIIGTAGGGLDDASWAANAEVARFGQRGEQQSAEILNALGRRRNGPTIMHDLAIPISGITANIDHVVVSGRRVLLIDSKFWKPGRYWTLGGRTRRGWARFDHAASKAPQMGMDSIAKLLARKGIQATVCTPLIAVWPSAKASQVGVRMLRYPGADVAEARKLKSAVRRRVGLRTADPAIVAALVPLVGALDRRAGR